MSVSAQVRSPLAAYWCWLGHACWFWMGFESAPQAYALLLAAAGWSDAAYCWAQATGALPVPLQWAEYSDCLNLACSPECGR